LNLAIYKRTLELLGRHGIREFAKVDYGDQLTQSRLEGADITVCVNQLLEPGAGSFGIRAHRRSVTLGLAFGSAGGQVAVEQREHLQVFGAACGFLGPDDVG
jgi:hypothetical protein